MDYTALSEVCEIIAGQSPSSKYYNQEGNGLPFFQGKADFGELYPSVRIWCSKPKKVAEAGDILISVRAPVGPTNLANQQCCIGRGLSAIRPTKKVDTKFLLFYLRFIEPKLSGQGRGSTFSAITQKELRALQIPLPPLAEQRRIAAILDKADALRAKRRAALAKLDTLLQSTFLTMFGDPVTNPMGWEVMKLGEIINDLRYGTGSPPKYTDIGIPFIRATNIKNGTIVENGLRFILQDEANKISKCKLKTGDLIIVRSGVNSGDCAIIPERYNNAYAGYDIIVEMPFNWAVFANHFINSPQGQHIIKPMTRRAGQPHLNADQIKSISLIKPHPRKLEQFKDFWVKIEQIKQTHLIALDELGNLFHALQQRAFKGEL